MTGRYGESPLFHRGKNVFCSLTRSFLPTQCALVDMRGSACKPDRSLVADGAQKISKEAQTLADLMAIS